MNKDRLKLFFIILSLFFISCEVKKDKKEIMNNIPESEDGFFDENGLGGFSSGKTITLSAHFNECGEWGGHIEEMVIYTKPKKGFYLDYRKYHVNCDSIDAFYNHPYQKLELSKTIQLNKTHKNSISTYLKRLVNSKIEEQYPGSAGNSFSAVKSDSTFIIEVYDNKKSDIESFNKLQKELGFFPTKIEKVN